MAQHNLIKRAAVLNNLCAFRFTRVDIAAHLCEMLFSDQWTRFRRFVSFWGNIQRDNFQDYNFDQRICHKHGNRNRNASFASGVKGRAHQGVSFHLQIFIWHDNRVVLRTI